MIGVLASVRVIVIDLIVGIQVADHADMSRIGDGYDRRPGDLTLMPLGGALRPAALLPLRRGARAGEAVDDHCSLDRSGT